MNNKKGFTLVEIITVVLIIGVLTAVAVPQYRRVMQKSHVTQAIAMLRSIADSSERLAQEFGYKSYPNLYTYATGHSQNWAYFNRMDMFSADNLPQGCSIDSSDPYKLNCSSGGASNSFSYKAHVVSGDNSYVVAKKTGAPYSGTYIALSRADNSLSCQGTQTACDVFGLNVLDIGASF